MSSHNLDTYRPPSAADAPLAPDASAPQAVAADWDAVRARLLTARRRVFAQLRQYPTPVTACDVQFNHLLEQRDRIGAELAHLDALHAQAERSAAAALAAFVRTSPTLADIVLDC